MISQAIQDRPKASRFCDAAADIYKIIYSGFRVRSKDFRNSLKTLARPAGLEPATPGLEGRCSV
jgi:hypothetical protein